MVGMGEDAHRIYQLLVLSMWADGRVDDAEQHALRALLATAPLADVGAEAERLALEARALLDSSGLSAAVTEIAGGLRDRPAQELAFVSCARVLEADRHIAQQEFQVLARLKAQFGLGAADVARLLRPAG